MKTEHSKECNHKPNPRYTFCPACKYKERKKAYLKAYQKTDKYKAYQKAYQKTDKYKALEKSYRAKKWKPPKGHMKQWASVK